MNEYNIGRLTLYGYNMTLYGYKLKMSYTGKLIFTTIRERI